MNTQGIIAKLNAGYGKLGNAVGSPMSFYRVQDPQQSPVTPGNLIGTQNVLISAQADFALSKPGLFNQIVFYGAFDATASEVGDYLVDSRGTTYFIVGLQALTPFALVKCNATVSIQRASAQALTADSSGYAVRSPISNAASDLAVNWPVSIVQGTKGEKDVEAISDSERLPLYQLTMPAIAGAGLETTDSVQDSNGVNYVVTSPYLSEQGIKAILNSKGT